MIALFVMRCCHENDDAIQPAQPLNSADGWHWELKSMCHTIRRPCDKRTAEVELP